MKNNKNISVAAEKFCKRLKREGLPSPSFTQYTHFRFLEKTSKMKEYMPRDHEFFKNNDEYFFPVKINFIYKIIASLMLPIIFYIMRDIGPADQ